LRITFYPFFVPFFVNPQKDEVEIGFSCKAEQKTNRHLFCQSAKDEVEIGFSCKAGQKTNHFL